MKKSEAQLKIDKDLLDKLDSAQRATAITNRDLAFILSITSCYLTTLRRRLQVSVNLRPKIKYVIKTLRMFQKESKEPIFRKPLTENQKSFNKRRVRLVKSFKSAFITILENLSKKG